MEENRGKGRPAFFESVEDLDKLILDYFDYIKGKMVEVKDKDGEKVGMEYERYPEPATITGLALHLGFESRQSFYDYEKNEDFSYTIKRARMRIESEYEKKLSGTACTGSIFALKNMGWKDKTEQEISVPKGVSVSYNLQSGNADIKDDSE